MLDTQNTNNIITGINTVFLMLVVLAIALTILVARGKNQKIKRRK